MGWVDVKIICCYEARVISVWLQENWDLHMKRGLHISYKLLLIFSQEVEHVGIVIHITH